MQRRRWWATGLCLCPLAALGCASPTAPPPPPGGGQQLTLDEARFEAEVWPVLRERGCDAEGDCHGGGIRGTLQLSAPASKSVSFDFEQVRHQVVVSPRESSPILTEPLALAAGGTPHAAKPFSTTADSGYQAILGWIMAGEVR